MASTYLEKLYDEYRRAAKAGQDEMESWTSEPTAEQIEKRDKAHADVQRLKAEIDKVKNFEELRQAGDAFREVATPVIERATGKAPSDGELFRAMLRNGGTYDARVSDRILNTYESPDLTLRALQSAGGSAIETSFADFVTVYERTFTPMLNPAVVTILNRTDGSPIVLPQLTADVSVAGTITADAGGVTEGDPTVASLTLNPYKYAITNLWSAELAQDNTIGLENLIAESTARSLSIAIGGALTTGDGSGDPNGFITAGTNGGTASGTSATFGTYFGHTDLVSLFYKPAAPNRANGVWQVSNTALAAIRNSRDANGNFLWQPSPAAGQPETLLGRPVYENPGMAAIGSVSKSVAFGNFKKYVVARVVPIRVESSIHYKFNTDQLALRTIERVDGDLAETAAIYYLVSAAV